MLFDIQSSYMQQQTELHCRYLHPLFAIPMQHLHALMTGQEQSSMSGHSCTVKGLAVHFHGFQVWMCDHTKMHLSLESTKDGYSKLAGQQSLI